MKNCMEVPYKTKIELPCDPAIPTLGIYPKEMKLVSQRDICVPMHCIIVHNSQGIETTCVCQQWTD